MLAALKEHKENYGIECPAWERHLRICRNHLDDALSHLAPCVDVETSRGIQHGKCWWSREGILDLHELAATARIAFGKYRIALKAVKMQQAKEALKVRLSVGQRRIEPRHGKGIDHDLPHS
jgi:hypothetical protein